LDTIFPPFHSESTINKLSDNGRELLSFQQSHTCCKTVLNNDNIFILVRRQIEAWIVVMYLNLKNTEGVRESWFHRFIRLQLLLQIP